MREKNFRLPAALLAALAVGAPLLGAGALTLSGCGSGGGDENITAPGAGGVMTRATEQSYSADARALVERSSAEPRLSAAEAGRIDADLARIRERFPAVQGIGARPRSDLHTLLVKPAADAPWLSRWQAGDASTGVPAVDAVVNGFGDVRVEAGPVPGWFYLRYAEPLAINVVGERLKAAAGGAVERAGPNLTLGDGPNILYTPPSGDGAARAYTFVRAWGDCPSGCIYEHFWKFSVSASGDVALVEEGGEPLTSEQQGAAPAP